jgi:hypothetical protein
MTERTHTAIMFDACVTLVAFETFAAGPAGPLVYFPGMLFCTLQGALPKPNDRGGGRDGGPVNEHTDAKPKGHVRADGEGEINFRPRE